MWLFRAFYLDAPATFVLFSKVANHLAVYFFLRVVLFFPFPGYRLSRRPLTLTPPPPQVSP